MKKRLSTKLSLFSVPWGDTIFYEGVIIYAFPSPEGNKTFVLLEGGEFHDVRPLRGYKFIYERTIIYAFPSPVGNILLSNFERWRFLWTLPSPEGNKPFVLLKGGEYHDVRPLWGIFCYPIMKDGFIYEGVRPLWGINDLINFSFEVIKWGFPSPEGY